MTHPELTALIIAELIRQAEATSNFSLYQGSHIDDDPKAFGVDGLLNVNELADAIQSPPVKSDETVASELRKWLEESDEPMAYETKTGEFFVEGMIDLVALVRFVRARP